MFDNLREEPARQRKFVEHPALDAEVQPQGRRIRKACHGVPPAFPVKCVRPAAALAPDSIGVLEPILERS
jgi:hypothetical protein